MNNDNKVETAVAGLNCWASYATGHIRSVVAKFGVMTSSQNIENTYATL